jgi:uncharacterized protein
MHKEEILFKESRIKIITDNKIYVKIAYGELLKQRKLLEVYITKYPEFKDTLTPINIQPNAPPIVRSMAYAGKLANVGPMAAVAGTIAELICNKMVKEGAKVAVVENGGDIFAITNTVVIIGIFVGKNKISGKFAFKLDDKNTPISICSSSSLMGHSLSFGKCDLATIASKHGNIADACATLLGNSIKEESDIDTALKKIISINGVTGALAIKNDKIGLIGILPPIIESKDQEIEIKVTKDERVWR